ncbi:MAG: hypothetical protein ACREBG_22235, partial [Pyrinomonadaceae bacterium]
GSGKRVAVAELRIVTYGRFCCLGGTFIRRDKAPRLGRKIIRGIPNRQYRLPSNPSKNTLSMGHNNST